MDKIQIWDLPDTKRVPGRYEDESVPDLTANNIKFLLDKLNEVIDLVNLIDSPALRRLSNKE